MYLYPKAIEITVQLHVLSREYSVATPAILPKVACAFQKESMTSSLKRRPVPEPLIERAHQAAVAFEAAKAEIKTVNQRKVLSIHGSNFFKNKAASLALEQTLKD